MKRLLVFALLFASGCIFCRAAFPPSIDPPEIKGGDLERGRYLVENVAACFACHGERDFRYYAAPIKADTKGAVGDRMITGKLEVTPPNISPSALKDWSDAELARAIVNGVSKDGTALFPVMPYPSYHAMSRRDLASMVAYLRTIPAQAKTEFKERALPGPLPFLVNAFVVEGDPPSETPSEGTPEYGAYLADLAACGSCHTPMKSGRPDESRAFAGGREFPLPGGGTIRASNLTPDKTGLKNYSKAAFIERFRAMTEEKVSGTELPPGSMNTVMPWTAYSGMSDEDLGAIFEHLARQAPIENKVIRFTPAN